MEEDVSCERGTPVNKNDAFLLKLDSITVPVGIFSTIFSNITQSRPDSGLGLSHFQAKVCFKISTSLLALQRRVALQWYLTYRKTHPLRTLP